MMMMMTTSSYLSKRTSNSITAFFLLFILFVSLSIIIYLCTCAHVNVAMGVFYVMVFGFCCRTIFCVCVLNEDCGHLPVLDGYHFVLTIKCVISHHLV